MIFRVPDGCAADVILRLENKTGVIMESDKGSNATDLKAILEENTRRRLLGKVDYEPETGIGASGDRVEVKPCKATDWHTEFVPVEMLKDEGFREGMCRVDWVRLRCRHDFEFWAAVCVKIKDKVTGAMVPFRLNAPQRRVAAVMERERLAGRPIRMIMLKARQWGGSTLVQMYMAWIQCTRQRNWHSLICAQVGKTAATIRGMYEEMLRNYPEDYWEGDEKPRLSRYQGQDLIREISGRNCRITLGSSESQDSIRGADYAMAHLSEVAFWKDTPKSSPTDFIRAICGAIALIPQSLVVLESTANGVGNYFHTEWLRSERGESDKVTVFVPWHEIDIYQREVSDVALLWNRMDAYERGLWEQGVTLERINWYQCKRKEYPSHSQMMAEYPTTPQEAFTNTGTNVFDAGAVERLRKECSEPVEVGEIASSTGCLAGRQSLKGLVFSADPTGGLKVWEHRSRGECYVVAVDVGGRSLRSDWSVIAVFSVRSPRVVAQWRGHIDHDLLAWKAAAIALYYNGALLVFESNTLESDERYGVEVPNQGAYMLHELYEHYPNIYHRVAPDGGEPRPGFHTNRATKQMVITELVGAVRDGSYCERDSLACDELMVYQRRANGSYGARPGYHDDILMTRAIGLHVVREQGAELIHCSAEADDDLRGFIRSRSGGGRYCTGICSEF